MLGTAIKILLVLQFALVATVPCRCVARHLAAVESVSPVECCQGGSCRLSAARENAAPREVDIQLCAKPLRKSACPGRLLPDLAPPPSAPADDLPALLTRAFPSGEALIVASDDAHHRRAAFTTRTAFATRPADQSLLRQHCALII